ncbi:hypothetical protein B0I31_11424 [Saccharothrix carnea]|uniref:Dual OB-containing domain-containing protein n=1 Tax=Saccharothrix carnea TaxID=1280637 RepID=A0A2P8I157_SACCR|nr:hypothetical protein [Saccharothrix carnea]PSL52197.1 hypothetical protein B0I31_11424 [Saccharothrix carnea]
MASTKLMVCLANSRKHQGRCVAGIVIGGGGPEWVRPVGARPGHGVLARERHYGGGVEPQVGDLISVPLVKSRPFGVHRENWLFDPAVRWRRVGRIGWNELSGFVEHPASLWVNGDHTVVGANDRVPVELQDRVVDSLKFIRVAGVTIEVSPAYSNGKSQLPAVRARFGHGGSGYALKVTDPVYEEEFRARGLGKYRLGESLLTVSLGEEYKGHFYKLVAAIVERPGGGPGGRR